MDHGSTMPEARFQEAVAHLQESLHLGEADAMVYVRLVIGGPSKVGDLADALGIHRNDVYRALERLQARGLTSALPGTPARYAARGADEAFEAEITSQTAAIASLRQSREEVVSIISQLHHVAASPASTYRVIQGQDDIQAARNRLIAESRSQIDLASSIPSTISALERKGGLAHLYARAQAGVKVRILAPDVLGTRDALRDLLKLPNCEARAFETKEPLRFYVSDQQEVLLWASHADLDATTAQAEVAVLARAMGLVAAQMLFFEQAWTTSEPMA